MWQPYAYYELGNSKSETPTCTVYMEIVIVIEVPMIRQQKLRRTRIHGAVT